MMVIQPDLKFDSHSEPGLMARAEAAFDRVARMQALFPTLYVWYIFFSALDIICTRIVLWFGGSESNPLAAHFINHGGTWGMIALKFLSVVLVIAIIETIGRAAEGRRLALARRLGSLAIAGAVFPVALGFGLLIGAR